MENPWYYRALQCAILTSSEVTLAIIPIKSIDFPRPLWISEIDDLTKLVYDDVLAKRGHDMAVARLGHKFVGNPFKVWSSADFEPKQENKDGHCKLIHNRMYGVSMKAC